MKNLILDGMKVSVDLRHEQAKRVNENYSTCTTNIHNMVKDSADMIDRLAAALMISKQAIRQMAAMMNLPDEKLNEILNVIETSDGKMLEAYEKIKK